MTAVLISSKFEDIDAIRMSTLLDKAGHNKFKQDEILRLETDILQTIGFKVSNEHSVYNESLLLFKKALKSMPLSADLLFKSEEYLMFLCHLSKFSINLTSLPSSVLASAILRLTVKYLRSMVKCDLEVR